MNKHIALFCLMFSTIAFGGELGFFGSKIDYWQAREESKPKKDIETLPSKTIDQQKHFEWSPYLDPKNDEFFKEGDYLPPAPFIEVARNPSDQNIKMWFTYLEQKNAVSQRLQLRINEYLGQSQAIGPVLPSPERPRKSVDSKRFMFRTYFDASCPHCQKMLETTLTQLKEEGFYVEAKQLDEKSFPSDRYPYPITKATSEEVRQAKITSVPLSIVFDAKTGQRHRLSGFHAAGEILASLAKVP